MPDIETLRSGFEAACQREPLLKYQIEGSLDWNEHGRCYYYGIAQQLFTGFCAGRKASQADDAIERYRNSGEFADSFPEECIDDLLAIAADYDRLKAENERLQSDLKLHSKRADDSNQTCIELMAEIERLKQFELQAEIDARKFAWVFDRKWPVPVDDTSHCANVLRSVIEYYEAVVDRVPKFADGSPALPSDEAWHPKFRFSGTVTYCCDAECADHFVGFGPNDDGGILKPLSECYPTREAMEKANV